MKFIFIYLTLILFYSTNIYSNEQYIRQAEGSNPGEYVWFGDDGIVRWSGGAAYWYLNIRGAGDGLTYNQTKSAIQSAFDTWDNVSTAAINFYYQSSSSDADSISVSDSKNILYWMEDTSASSLYHLHNFNNQIYALTILTVNSSLNIIDADIIFNGADFAWDTDDDDGHVDIQGIATHEIGHLFGLGHSYDDNNSAMRPSIAQYQSDFLRTLYDIDRTGISFLYGTLITSRTVDTGLSNNLINDNYKVSPATIIFPFF